MTLRKCIKMAKKMDVWFRPKSLRGCGWAYGLHKGYVIEMPLNDGDGYYNGVLWQPHCDIILDKWEIVDPETVWKESP